MTNTEFRDGFALNNKISLRQLQALLFLEIFGFGVTALPRRVAESAAQDGWVSVLAATAMIIPVVMIISHLTKLARGLSFHNFACSVLSKPLGVAVSLIFCSRLVLLAAFNLRIFAEITRQTMLPATPFAVIFVSMLMLAAYGAAKGIETRARMAEVLILVVLLPLIFVFGISGRDIDITNLAPVMVSPIENILAGSFSAFFAFSGIEVLLLLSPYLSRPKHLTKSSAQVTVTIGIFMAIVTAVTISRFGPEGITHQMWPVLKMMDTISLPGSITDRQGALIMTFWIISAYAIINAALFFSSLLLKDVMGRGQHSGYILALVPIIAILAYLPKNLVTVYDLHTFSNSTIGLATMAGIPLIIFIIAKIRGMKLKNARL
ncbi:MAG: endospore germination permease [Clostridiales bacterium]|jgi:spore germination protein|nr:endospore germination permease [Clostridiales bacterium]